MKRRTFLAGAAGALGVAAVSACGNRNQTAETSGSGSAGGALTITDVADRTVTLESAPTKIILGESRQAYSLLFLQRDNLMDKVVAWGTDIQSAAPDIYDRVVKAQPKAADLPTIGSVAKGDLSVENLLEYNPDLFLMTLEQYEAAKQAGFDAKLDSAKIPYLVTDFRKKPVENTHTSVRLLGQAFGVSDKAEEFLTYYDSLVNPVLEAAKAKAEADRPSVFVWRSPGISEPGRTFGESNFGQIVTASGGNNLGTKLIDGDAGTGRTDAEGGMFHRQKHGPRVLRPARLSDDDPSPVPGPGCRHVWGMSQVRGGGWAVAWWLVGLLVWHDGWVVCGRVRSLSRAWSCC